MSYNLMLFITYAVCKYFKPKKKKRIIEKNTPITLYSIFDVPNEEIIGKNIILKEVTPSSSKYDLLERKTIVNQIIDSIYISKTQKNIIGLDGQWGSGKTTVINFTVEELLKNKNNIIIRNFDFMKFNDEYSMIVGLMKEIKSCLKLLSANNLSVYKMLNEIFSANAQYKILIGLLNLVYKANITTEINDYLTFEKKNLIIILENIDRNNDKDKIISVLNMLYGSINLERTTFIITYDKKIVLNCFNNHIYDNAKNTYLYKIVDKELSICNIKNENKYKMIITGLIEKFCDANKINVSNVEDVISYIAVRINSIRDIRIIFNHMSIVFACGQFNISDMLLVSFLNYKDQENFKILKDSEEISFFDKQPLNFLNSFNKEKKMINYFQKPEYFINPELIDLDRNYRDYVSRQLVAITDLAQIDVMSKILNVVNECPKEINLFIYELINWEKKEKSTLNVLNSLFNNFYRVMLETWYHQRIVSIDTINYLIENIDNFKTKNSNILWLLAHLYEVQKMEDFNEKETFIRNSEDIVKYSNTLSLYMPLALEYFIDYDIDIEHIITENEKNLCIIITSYMNFFMNDEEAVIQWRKSNNNAFGKVVELLGKFKLDSITTDEEVLIYNLYQRGKKEGFKHIPIELKKALEIRKYIYERNLDMLIKN